MNSLLALLLVFFKEHIPSSSGITFTNGIGCFYINIEGTPIVAGSDEAYIRISFSKQFYDQHATQTCRIEKALLGFVAEYDTYRILAFTISGNVVQYCIGPERAIDELRTTIAGNGEAEFFELETPCDI